MPRRVLGCLSTSTAGLSRLFNRSIATQSRPKPQTRPILTSLNLESLEDRQLLAIAVPGLGTGLVANYFRDDALTDLVVGRVESAVNFNWGSDAPLNGLPVDGFSVDWRGKVQAQFDEIYTFYAQSAADDGLRLTIYTPNTGENNGRKANVLIDTWSDHTGTERSGSLALQAGETYDIKLEYTNTTGSAAIALRWSSPSTPKGIIPATQFYPSQVLSTASVSGSWLNSAIGGPAIAGSFTSDAGVYALTAGGTGIGGASDQFQFAYQTLLGDGIAITKVDALSGAGLSSSAKAGLMFRTGSAANAPFVGLFATTNGVLMQARESAGAAAVNVASSGPMSPIWLKLVRQGPTINGYTSVNGDEWTWLGRFDIQRLSNQLLVGLAGTSAQTSQSISGRLVNVSIKADIPLGSNFGGLATYSATQPFIDLVKGGMGAPLKLDSSGNPGGSPANLNAVDDWPAEDFGFKGPYLQKPDAFSGVDYTLTFTGKATVSMLSFAGGVITPASSVTGDPSYVNGYNSPTNSSKWYLRSTSWAASDANSIAPIFRNTQRTASSPLGSGVTNIKLLQTGYSGYDENQVFTNEWLASAERAKVLRLMDWSETNNNLDTNWTDRTLVGDHWRLQGAWEYQLQLANRTQRDLWINIPAHATNDYITKLAKLIRYGSDGVNPYSGPVANPVYPGLDPDLNVYVEYSNEVWNGLFEAWAYASNQANAAYNSGAKFGPSQATLNFDGTSPAAGSQQRVYRWLAAHLVGDIVGSFRQVFGTDSISTRVRPVLAGWQLQPEQTIEQGLEMVKAAGWNVTDNLYAVSVTGYWNDTAAAQAQLTSGTAEGAATVEEVLDHLDGSARANENGTAWQTLAAIATRYGLKGVGYETGPSIGGTLAEAAAQMDPRFRKLAVEGFNNWFASGAELSNYFSIAYTNAYGSPFGDWVISDNRWDENQPRAQAFDDIRSADSTSPITAGFTALPKGELDARDYVSNLSPESTFQVQNLSPSSGRSFSYLVRAASDMDVRLRVNYAATQANQSIKLSLNDQAIHTYTFGAAATLDPAGNAIYTDTTPVTIHLRTGLNTIALFAPAFPGSPRINSLKFAPVGETFPNSAPWAYNLLGGTQTISESTSRSFSTIDFQDLETPAAVNLTSPFTVTAQSDNPALIPNNSNNINWTYNQSTTSWTLKITPTAGMTGTVNLTVRVADPGGVSRSWTFPVQVTPANPQSVTATTQANGSVLIRWNNPSPTQPSFTIERSLDRVNWTQVGVTTPQPSGSRTWTDAPPGGASWYYRVTATTKNQLKSTAVPANSGAAAVTPATSVVGTGLNSTSLFTGKTYFTSALRSGVAANAFDGTSNYLQFQSTGSNSVAVVGLAGTSPVSVVNLSFPIVKDAAGNLSVKIPPGVSIFYSTNNYAASGSTVALSTANYTRLGTTSLSLASASVPLATDKVYQVTLSGLAIPSNARSILLVFDGVTGGTPAHLAEIQAFVTLGVQAASQVGLSTSWVQPAPTTFQNYYGSAVQFTWTNPNSATSYSGLVVQRDNTGDWTGSDLRTFYLPRGATSFVNDRDRQELNLNPDAASWDSTRNTPLAAGVAYSYRIGVWQANGTIAYGSPLRITTAAQTNPISSPSGLVVTATSNSSIQLMWNSVAGAVGYKIERSLNSQFASYVTDVAQVTGTSYTDRTLIPNQVYYYRVRTVSATSGDSRWSTASAATRAIGPAPTDLIATAGQGIVELDWQQPTGKIYSYEVFRGTSLNSLQPYRTYQQGGSPIITPHFVDTSATGNTTYYYAVRGMLFNSASPGGSQYTSLSNVAAAGVKQGTNPVPTITMNDATTTEGNSATKNLIFTVSLSAASMQAVQVNFATADGTALASNSDYNSTSGILTFAPGVTSQFITVQIAGDTAPESNETFSVTLSSPINAVLNDIQGLGTITNDDPAPPAGDLNRQFDFNATGSATQTGYWSVLPTTLYNATTGYGWTASPSAIDRGVVSGTSYSGLLRDGHYSSRTGTGSNPNAGFTFLVNVPNGDYWVNLTMGDKYGAHDQMQANAEGGSAELVLSNAYGQYTVSGFAITVTDGQLTITFSDLGGSNNEWALNALTINTLSSVDDKITLTEQSISPSGVMTLTGSGAHPNSLVTLSTSLGTITSADAGSVFTGTQVLADASGTFSTVLQAPAASGTVTIIAAEIDGRGRGRVQVDIAELAGLQLHMAPLSAAKVQAAPSPKLVEASSDPLCAEAIDRWMATGLSEQQVANLKPKRIEIASFDAGSRDLRARSERIQLDDNAAGDGWPVDSTLQGAQELSRRISAAARLAVPASIDLEKIDLQTAIRTFPANSISTYIASGAS